MENSTDQIEAFEKNGMLIYRLEAVFQKSAAKIWTKISGVIPQREMTWSSGIKPLFSGMRKYSLREENGSTVLVVEELFEGWLLPMMKKKLPDCETLFGNYVVDLREALK